MVIRDDMAIFNFFKKSKTESAPSQPTAKESAQQTSQDWLNALMNGGVGSWNSKFVSDIYNEQILLPHDEMQISQKAYRYCSFVQNGVNTRSNFLTGGTFEVVSDDKKTMEYLNKRAEETRLKQLVAQNAGRDVINIGNFYAERIYADGKVIVYEYLPSPERMYVITDEKGIVQSFFQEVPEYLRKGQFKTIKYYGDRMKSIRGLPIEKNKVFHLKLGVAEIPCYGRGLTASITNDVKILFKIERSIAIIAAYKAVPKKIIQLINRQGDPSATQAATAYANQFSNMLDLENPVIGEEIKIDDLSYNGKDVNFEPFVNYLKKKITAALAPDFLMHGDLTNYAVSRDQREAFVLTINAEREALKEQLKKELKLIAKLDNVPVKEFDVSFGDWDIGQSEDKKNYVKDLFLANIITLNEARDMLEYEADAEIGDSYHSEIQQQGSLFGLGKEVKYDSEDK
jgi:hypothetical protein